MVNSRKGQTLIGNIPRNCVLTETDGPFINANGEPARPIHISHTTNGLAKLWNVEPNEARRLVAKNFQELIFMAAKIPYNNEEYFQC